MIVVDETDPIGELEAPFEPRQIELRQDEEVRDYYDMKKEIGRGRFGTVYLCNCRQTGVKFASKFINTKRKLERRNVEREIEIMKTLHEKRPHPKLIQLYDAFDMKTEMCLILEIVDGGELFERVINDDFVLTERACVVIVKQICTAVEYIHSKNILHLDMKPENILCLSWEGNRIKICDFGLARKYDPRKKLQVLFGTPEFVAPEVVNFEPISFGTDMWSVGVICYVLLSGLSPFMGHNFVETMTNVTKNQYDFDDEAFDDVSDEAINFIKSLLILDKSERLTSTQCLRHDWLRKPLQPSTRVPRRRSTTVSTDDESSSDHDQKVPEATPAPNKQEDPETDDEDDDVFAVPAKVETDEGKKRKISEDVLEKNNTVSDKKRKDDDDTLSDKKAVVNDAEEKMSTSSLNTSMMAEQDSCGDKTEDDSGCGSLSQTDTQSASVRETTIPVSITLPPVKSKEEISSVKVITQSQTSDDPMSGLNIKKVPESVTQPNTSSLLVKDFKPDINSVKPFVGQRAIDTTVSQPKRVEEVQRPIVPNTSKKTEVLPPSQDKREAPIAPKVTSETDKKEVVRKEPEAPKSTLKPNTTPQIAVHQKAGTTIKNVNKMVTAETRPEQKSVPVKTSVISEVPKTASSQIEQKPTSTQQKTQSPVVTKDLPKPHPIEVKTPLKPSTPQTKVEPPVIQKKEADKPTVRRREVPIAIEKHEVSKAVVRKREVPMTPETGSYVRRRGSQETIKVDEKPESKGRIVPITLEEDDVKPQIRKREMSSTVNNADATRQRHRQPQVAVSTGTDSSQAKSVPERRRETPVVKKEPVAEPESQTGTTTRGNECKRETIVVSSKKMEEEPKSNAKRELILSDVELAKTKKQLKDFVERWNHHPDSPYIVGTPLSPHELEISTKEDGWNSRASLASVAVAPPSLHDDLSDFSDVEMVDVEGKEEFTHYVFDQPHPDAINKPEVIAKQLEQKLNILKASESMDHSPNAGTSNTSVGRSNSSVTKRARQRNDEEPPKRPEIDALQRDEPRIRRRPSAAADLEHGNNRSRTNSSSTSKMPPGRDVPLTCATSPGDITKKVEDISISDRRDSSPARRQRPTGRHRPSRDMPTKPNKDGFISIPIAYEPEREIKKSRSTTPTRRGRKTSREDRNSSKGNSRAHSRESNQSSTGKGHRRPSRDAPMTSAQTERLGFLNISGCEATEGAEADFLWPDMRVVPQSDDVDFDDNDDDSEAALLEPVTFKLELPVVTGDITTDHSTTKIPLPNDSPSTDHIQERPSLSPLKMNIADEQIIPSAKASLTSIASQSIASSPITPLSTTTSKSSLVSTTTNVGSGTPQPVSNIPHETKAISVQNSTNISIPAPASKCNSISKIDNDSQTKPNSNETTYVSENKLVAWIMDLGKQQQKKLPLSGSTTDLVSHFEGHEVVPNRGDRDKSPRPRDRSPMAPDRNREKTTTAPKPPFGCPLTREKSSGSINSSDTSENIIQTPWGTLKRSTSRNSINKSPSKNSVNSSPTATSLLRTVSSEIPLIRLEEEMDTSQSIRENRNSFGTLENRSSKSPSRSPSPRSFRPYNKSLTTKNLSESTPSSVGKPSFYLGPSRSSSSLNKDVERSPSPPLSRPPIPSPTLRPNRLSFETKSENASRTNLDHEGKMSSFDKKVTKQTSLEVLNHSDKHEPPSLRVSPSNGVDKSPSEVKFNTLPRPTSWNKDTSPSSSRSSSKPPSGDSKRNSIEMPSGERRKSRTLAGVPMPPRKQFSFLLFSAHDRISEFEKKDDDKPATRTQRPITRSKTSTSFTDENTKSRGNSPLQVSASVSDKQLRDDKKNSVRPSVVSSKFPLTYAASPPLTSNSRFNLPLTTTSFSAINPISPIESSTCSPGPLSPTSPPSSPFKFPPAAKLKTSSHIGFMRDRFIEKQAKITPVTPFSSASSVSRITSNKNNGFDQMNGKLHRRIKSVNSLS